jgi:N utilization substance protein B
MTQSSGARSRARDLLVQALYQMQISGHDWEELQKQFRERRDYENVDREYFDESLAEILRNLAALEQSVADLADRPLVQLDPVERGILLLGIHELESRAEIPYRVVINEAVNLARRFGAVDGHKYVNAVLDRAALRIRPTENRGNSG